MSYIFALAFGVGVAAGLRSLTPPAVVAWAAHLGWLNLNNSPLAFMGSIITVVIFSILALFELFVDLRPSTPKRTAPIPLGARILMGGLCGACLYAASNQPLVDRDQVSERSRRQSGDRVRIAESGHSNGSVKEFFRFDPVFFPLVSRPVRE